MIGAITAGLYGAGVPPVVNSYESIATVTGTGSSATLSFTSIPSGYKHLQIRGVGQETGGGSGNQPMVMRLNSDTGNNYTAHLLYGVSGSIGGAASAPRDSYYWIGEFPKDSNVVGPLVLDLLDYQNTNKYKTVRSLGGYDSNSNGRIDYASGVWMNTAAVTRIDMTIPANNWSTNTKFALYGIKG